MIEDVVRGKEDIIDRFKSIRRVQVSTKRIHELVELLEDVESEFHFQDADKATYKANQQRYKDFCKAYMILLFKEFIVDNDDIEIMLVAYNFHPEYDHIKQRVRRKDTFAREKYEPNHPDKNWGPKPEDKDSALRDEENRIIEVLAGILAKFAVENGGILGFAKSVLEQMELKDSLAGIEETANSNKKPYFVKIEPADESDNISGQSDLSSSLDPSPVEPSPPSRSSDKKLRYMVGLIFWAFCFGSFFVLAACHGSAEIQLGSLHVRVDFRSDYMERTQKEQTEQTTVDGNPIGNNNETINGYIWEQENEQEDVPNEKS